MLMSRKSLNKTAVAADVLGHKDNFICEKIKTLGQFGFEQQRQELYNMRFGKIVYSM